MNAREMAAAAVEWSRTAGQRLALGTGLLLHGAGGWLAPEDSGKRFVARSGGALVGVAFYGQLLGRAPYFVAAVPVVWAVAAWRMSDSSATPPPDPDTPLGHEEAGQEGERWYPSPIVEGVAWSIQPPVQRVEKARKGACDERP
ncbi:hypothetical protein HUT19_22770 [Streptomyces sp. NA02950]|uniref:hypothetical protein n=1 Tax=Streptomyces sp. NA02950 TaxID=2742137 RepID=UPI001591EE3A|nr:hypothetical protein [Streptomyces sp. NA02950]QKV94233.1 hypothetical protein HUT19_22770 [Streptomyces sp. NA02950]